MGWRSSRAKPGCNCSSGTAAIFAEAIPKAVAAAPDAVLVAASNPVDVMTGLKAKIAPLPPGRVLVSGAILE